jgi:PPE-repeat protein
MDYALLPPEINSLRIWTGPGSGPMMAAASAWEGLAAELGNAAADFAAVIAGLGVSWLGPSATAMAASATRYQSWLLLTAQQAAQTGAQASAAGAAFEAAFAATVPPPLIAENRARLAMLVATNFLGVNTPAIMATEAHYMEMWAQDVAAMTAYHAASAGATRLTPFKPLVPLTTGVQAAPVSTGAGTAQTFLGGLQNLSPQSFSDVMSAFQALGSMGQFALTPLMMVMDEGLWGSPAGSSAASGAAEAGPAVEMLPEPVVNVPPANWGAGSPGGNVGSVSVQAGGAARLGGLSVPPGWSSQVETARPVTPLGSTPIVASEVSESTGFPGIFTPAVGGRGEGPEKVRYGFPVKNVITGHPSAG